MVRFTIIVMTALLAIVTVTISVGHDHTDYFASSWQAEPFRTDHEYEFRYDAQTSTGYAIDAENNVNQLALNRFQATVRMTFTSPTMATLSLSAIRVTQRNGAIGGYSKMPTAFLPLRAFERRILPSSRLNKENHKIAMDHDDYERQLEMPVQLIYTPAGSVASLRFDNFDGVSSRNLKKAILNLMQIRLRSRRQVDGDETVENDSSSAQRAEARRVAETEPAGAWTTTETTVEGECAVSYTVWPTLNGYNATKSIDFARCSKTADVLFGYQMEPLSGCWPADETPTRGNSDFWTRSTCGGALSAPATTLRRSTVFQYTLGSNKENHSARYHKNNDDTNEDRWTADGGANKYALQRVNVVSNYEFVDGSMRTLTIGQLTFARVVSAETAYDVRMSASPAESLLYNAEVEASEKQFYALGENGTSAGRPIANAFLGASEAARDERAAQLMARAEHVFDALVNVYAQNNDEGAEGINGLQATNNFEKLIALVRMMSADGLHQLHKRATAAKRANCAPLAGQLYANALAAAGTRNTVDALVELSDDASAAIDAWRALRALATFGSTSYFAPSDALADALLRTCRLAPSEVRDACWLAFGALAGQLDAQSRRTRLGQTSPTSDFERVAQHKMDLYKNVLLDMLMSAKTPLQQIVAMKAIGNAALDGTAPAIFDIALDAEQTSDVRLHAIDALRRFFAHPLTDARAGRDRWTATASLLPLVANRRERREVRVAALAAIARGVQAWTSAKETTGHSAAESSLVAIGDQIAKILQDEPDEEVRGFAISIGRMVERTSVRRQHDLVHQYIKNMVGVRSSRHPFEQLVTRHSHYERIFPVGSDYSFNVQAIYGQRKRGAPLPVQISLQWDAIVGGGVHQRAVLHFGVIQRNSDALLRELAAQWHALFGGANNDENIRNQVESEKVQTESTTISPETKSFLKKAIDSVSRIIHGYQTKYDKSYNTTTGQTLYAIMTLRYNDIDTLVWPITDSTVAPLLAAGRSGVNAGQLFKRIKRVILGSDSQLDSAIRAALSLNTQKARLPTSVGWPLVVESSNYALGSLTVGVEPTSSNGLRLTVQPNIVLARLERMRIWTTGDASAGASAARHLEINAPLKADTRCHTAAAGRMPANCEITVPIGKSPVRLFGYHSHPTTMITAPRRGPNGMTNQNDSINSELLSADSMDAHIGAIVTMKTIDDASRKNINAHPFVGDIELAVPLRVYGHFYVPRTWRIADVSAAMAAGSPADLHVHFEPRNTTPRAITFTVSAAIFQPESDKVKDGKALHGAWSRIREGLDAFYAGFASNFFEKARRSDEFDELKPTEYHTNYVENNTRALNAADGIPYRHEWRLVAETVDGATKARVEVNADAVCDALMRACEARINATHAGWPVFDGASWSGSARMQVIYPEMVENVAQLDDGESDAASATMRRRAKVFIRADSEWGSESAEGQKAQGKRQSVKINVLGVPTAALIRRAMDAEETRVVYRNASGDGGQTPTPSSAATIPFIDEYKIVASYQLNSDNRFAINNAIGALKTAYFWQSKSQLRVDSNLDTDSQDVSEIETIKAIFRLDPDVPALANLTLETAEQRVFVRAMRTPGIVPMIALVASTAARTGRLAAAIDAQRSDVNALVALYLPAPAVHFADIWRAIVDPSTDHMCSVTAVPNGDTNTSIVNFGGTRSVTSFFFDCFRPLAGSCDMTGSSPNHYQLSARLYHKYSQQKTYRITFNNDRSRVIFIEPATINDWRLAVTVDNRRFVRNETTSGDLDWLREQFGITFWTKSDSKYEIVRVNWPGHFVLAFNGIDANLSMDDNKNFGKANCGLCGAPPDSNNHYNNIDINDNKNYNQFSEKSDFCDDATIANSLQNSIQRQRSYSSVVEQRKVAGRSEWHNEKPKSERRPVARTLVVEYNHKVCFSRQPISQCSESLVPADASGERDFLRNVKAPVVCLPRDALETRRIRAQIDARGVADVAALADYTTSYAETVTIPERCLVF